MSNGTAREGIMRRFFSFYMHILPDVHSETVHVPFLRILQLAFGADSFSVT